MNFFKSQNKNRIIFSKKGRESKKIISSYFDMYMYNIAQPQVLCTIITKLLLDWTTTTGLDYYWTTGPQSHKPYCFTCFLTHHLSRDRACAGGKNCNTDTRYKHFRSLEDGILGLCIVSESKFISVFSVYLLLFIYCNVLCVFSNLEGRIRQLSH